MSLDERLTQLFEDVFGLEGGEIPEASAESLEAWDSIGHVRLMMAIEGEFEIALPVEEMPDLVTFEVIRNRLRALVSE